MDVSVERIIPFDDAFARLQNAPLENAGDEEIQIYANAHIRIAECLPDELNPTSCYVLRENLQFQRDLRAHLRDRYQIDPFQLPGILHLKSNGKSWGLTPPIVEVYEEHVRIIPKPGDHTPPELHILLLIIKDGLHRIMIAREEGALVRCVLISGAHRDHRPYAYPNPWSQVMVCDTVPKDKKYYRRKDPYTFMRPIRVLRDTGDEKPGTEYGRK